MLEVYPIQDKKEQERMCGLCGIEYKVDRMAYSGYVKGELVGVLQFGIHGDAGYIYDLENVKGTENTDALFVMGRAALNFIDLCNVKKAYFKGYTEGREDLVKFIGFSETENGDWFMDLTGFFEGGSCQCEKK
ncbi:MAG: hypothetical protein E7652_02635 [Ruminococcaceae bacterium]|nr:hypothetical protein [Oscillospiraceae bacterium]